MKKEVIKVTSDLKESESKCSIIKTYADETKKNLNIAKQENEKQLAKIEELIKENLRLTNEHNHSLRSKRIQEPNEIRSQYNSIAEKNINKKTADISEEQSVSVDIDTKVQGILERCK